MSRLVLFTLILLLSLGCTHTSTQSDYVGRSVEAVLEAEKTAIEECQISDEPPGVVSKVTFLSKRTGKTVAIRLRRTNELFSASRSWAINAITNAKVTSVEEREPAVKLIVPDVERERWRESMAELRSDSGSKHGAFLFFSSHNSKEAVPFLIKALASYSKLEDRRTVDCAIVHCVDALRMQTGKDFWLDAQAYSDWWKNEGRYLPDSYFDARRRTHEAERKWKLEHPQSERPPPGGTSETCTRGTATTP